MSFILRNLQKLDAGVAVKPRRRQHCAMSEKVSTLPDDLGTPSDFEKAWTAYRDAHITPEIDGQIKPDYE